MMVNRGKTHIENATKDTKNLSLLLKNDVTGIIPANSDLVNLDYTVQLNNLIAAPIQEGSVLGKITYNFGEFKYSADLIAAHSVEEYEPITLLWQIALALFVLFIFAKLLLPKKKSKRKKTYKSKKSGSNNNSIYKF